MNATAPAVPVAGTPPAPLPWLGVFAVLVGAVATTLTSRLTSIGLADVRGAIGAGFDEGAWIPTAFSASQMMIGPTGDLPRPRVLAAPCAAGRAAWCTGWPSS